ncbi:leucine-rich repeat-containing protein 74B-like [Saccostrea echinata]|uniref:leucine-rich repeat-containing protein 74B-like n=1 Tax=Saccostrea echinata TaxID=191078 RepID=UPI002A7FE619|nr:leucine-rich repeat-containing protein 74B-like [Saccostrea echinata]
MRRVVHTRQLSPLRQGKLPKIRGRNRKTLPTRPSSECLIRDPAELSIRPTELSVRPNSARPEGIIDDKHSFRKVACKVNNIMKMRRKKRTSKSSNADESDEYEDESSDCETVLDDVDNIGMKRLHTTEDLQYRSLCEELGIIPCNAFVRQLNNPHANISYNQLMPIDFRAISIILINNACITSLNVSNNNLGTKGVTYLADVITENPFIEKLEMSAVNMDATGFKSLTKALLENKSITYLDISKNNIDKKNAEDMAKFIRTNDYIEHLNLSGNLIDSETGCILGPAIASNLTIKYLDLSWNHIRRQGARIITESICKNVELEHVNLSWNGLAEHGCRAFGTNLSKNHTLRILDVSHNRITFHTLGNFLKGLQSNSTLQNLKIYGNPITTDGALAILKVYENSQSSVLEEIDIQDIPIDEKFQRQAWNLMEKRNIKLHHRDLVTKPITHIGRTRHLNDFNPVLILFEYMRQEGFRLVDLFRTLDTDNDRQISRDELKAGFAKMNVHLTNTHIDQVLGILDKDRNNTIDYSEMIKGRRYADHIRQSSQQCGRENLAEMMVDLQKLMKKARIEKQTIKSAMRRKPQLLPENM